MAARSCGWWWPFKNCVILTDRPISLHRDDQGRLHNPDGMAIQYGDGWGVFSWHGTRVPAEVITSPQSISSAQIINERNSEVRRVMIERYGQDRFVLDSGAKTIDTDQENGAELLSIDLPGDPERYLRALKLLCPSTSACYIVRVPPNQSKAREALAWSYQLSSAKEYHLVQQS